MHCRIVVEGTVMSKATTSFDNKAKHRLVIGWMDVATAEIGKVTVNFQSAADLAAAPGPGTYVRAQFATAPSGEYQNEFRQGALIDCKALTAAIPPAGAASAGRQV